jgi:hypothetical protein
MKLLYLPLVFCVLVAKDCGLVANLLDASHSDIRRGDVNIDI